MNSEITGKDIRIEMAAALVALSKKHQKQLEGKLHETKMAGLFAQYGRLNHSIGALDLPDHELASVPGVRTNHNGIPYLPSDLVTAEIDHEFNCEVDQTVERRMKFEALPEAQKDHFHNPDEQAKQYGDVIDWHYVGRANKKTFSVQRSRGSSEVTLRKHIDEFASDGSPVKRVLSQDTFPSLKEAVAAAYQSLGFPIERERTVEPVRSANTPGRERHNGNIVIQAADSLRHAADVDREVDIGR